MYSSNLANRSARRAQLLQSAVLPLVLVMVAALNGCAVGGTAETEPTLSTAAIPTLKLTPQSAQVRVGGVDVVTATPTNLTSTLGWSVSCAAAQNGLCGSINNGIYTAPAAIPAGGTVTVSASSTSGAAVSATTTLTILNPLPFATATLPASIAPGVSTVTITGAGFVAGTTVSVAPNGVTGITAVATYVNANNLSVAIVTPAYYAGTLELAVTNPDPGASTAQAVSLPVSSPVTYDAAVRFLRQSTFGPTPALIAHVQSVGYQAFLNEQFAARPSQYTLSQWWYETRDSVLRNQVLNNDQLRQRVSLSLSEILVTSYFGGTTGIDAFPVWLNTLQNEAFSNYGKVLHDALNLPALNQYLTNVDNDATSDPGQHISQNLGRETLQLFSVGPYLLNQDGSQILDSNGQPIATYDNTVIDGVSRALTGWTLDNGNGPTAYPRSEGFLFPLDNLHDQTAKHLLNGYTSTPGQGAAADLNTLVWNIMQHPNVAPFISRRLIQSLVTSNPTPAYIQRVATVFANDGKGNVGNLQAVVAAILLDPEARAGDDPANTVTTGHVEEPILYTVGILRALQASLLPELLVMPAGNDDFGPWAAADIAAVDLRLQGMGQDVLYSPSVFNYFQFNHQLPGSTTFAPEMQIETSSTVIARANFVDELLYSWLNFIPLNTSWLNADAQADPVLLVQDLNHYLAAGRLDATTTQTIVSAVNAIPSTNPTARASQAIYLILTSAQYQVIQ